MTSEANLVLVTTMCSGGCQYCPFSRDGLEKSFLSPKIIEKIMSGGTNKLTILSGGEPFEHPEISKILTSLGKQTQVFRVATGGFINLVP